MVKLADTLEEDELKAMCSVQTADGWYSAVGRLTEWAKSQCLDLPRVLPNYSHRPH